MRLLTHCAILALLLGLTPSRSAVGRDDGDVPSSAKRAHALNELANKGIFRVAAAGDGFKSQGTAVLIDLDATVSPARARFVTVYHVLQRATSFEIFDYAQTVVAKTTPETRCFEHRGGELAIVDITLEPGVETEMSPITLRPPTAQPELKKSLINPTGDAIGFPIEGNGTFEKRYVTFVSIVPASVITGMVKPALQMTLEDLKLAPHACRFQKLTGEMTQPGMSGGPVIDQSLYFGGLIFGSRIGDCSWIIPAQSVLEVIEAADAPPHLARWTTLSSNPFKKESLFANPGSSNAQLRQANALADEYIRLESYLKALDAVVGERSPMTRDAEPQSPRLREIRDELQEVLEKVKASDPSIPVGALEPARSVLAQAQGNSQEAIELANPVTAHSLIEGGPSEMQQGVLRLRTIGHSQSALGQWAEAAETYKTILSTPLAQAPDYTMAALAFYRAGNNSEALQVCNDAISQIDPAFTKRDPIASLAFTPLYYLRPQLVEDNPDQVIADFKAAISMVDNYLATDTLDDKYDLRLVQALNSLAGAIQYSLANKYDDVGRTDAAVQEMGFAANRLRLVLMRHQAMQWMRAKISGNDDGEGEQDAKLNIVLEPLKLADPTLDAPDAASFGFTSVDDVQRLLADVLLQRARVSELDILTKFQEGQLEEGWKGKYVNVVNDLSEAGQLQIDFDAAESASETYGSLTDSLIYFNQLLYARGSYDESKAALLKAIDVNRFNKEINADVTLEPSLEAERRLAWLLATCPDPNVRNGVLARQLAANVREAELRNAARSQEPYTLSTLAAAEAELGNFESAIQFQQQAIDLAAEPDRDAEESVLRQYRAGLPRRHDPLIAGLPFSNAGETAEGPAEGP
jgi:tetratricopeptide (TPR) repeat protein